MVSIAYNPGVVGNCCIGVRSCPVLAGQCVADGTGTVHIVVWSAGATVEKGGFSRALSNFSIARLDDYGYLRVDANRSRMLVQFVRTNPGNGTAAGGVWDQVELRPWL